MGTILIRGCDVVDGMANPLQRNMDVLVEGNRIARVEPTGGDWTDTLSPAAERIDGAGKTVMPGMIDAHCHMTYGESFTQEEQDIYTSVESRTLRSAWNVQKVLFAGVTGISQPGGSYFIGVAIRDGIKSGRVKGPRMTSAGRYITTSNGLTDWYPDDAGVIEGGIGIRCNTLDEMIAEVRRQVKNGVDLIKLADSPYGEYQSFRDVELQEIADLVHQLNRRCTIHARGDAEMRASVRAGFDWVMHGNVMEQETVEQLAATGTLLIPTLLLLHQWAEHGELIGTPRHISEACKRMLDRTHKSLHLAREAGVIFGLGTDTGFAMTPYGEWHAKEIELLMDYAGLSPVEAIAAATYNNGRTLNLEGQVGAVAPGMLADLLVVAGDPSRRHYDPSGQDQVRAHHPRRRVCRGRPGTGVLGVRPCAHSGQPKPDSRASGAGGTERSAAAARRGDATGESDCRMTPGEEKTMVDRATVHNKLREVIDPELGLDVVELGMVGRIEADDGVVLVNMRLTSMSCPFWELFVEQVRSAVGELDGVERVAVQFDRHEPWRPELMTEAARGKLEAVGLMPPPATRGSCHQLGREELLQIVDGVLGSPFPQRPISAG